MGRATNKALKELMGHPSDVGRDLLSVGAGSLSGIVAHTVQDTADGVSSFVVPRNGFLDFVCANASPSVGAGSLNVAVYKNGSLVGSGSFTSSNPDRVDMVYSPKSGNQVTIASGDTIAAHYSVTSELSLGVQTTAVNTRIGLTYRE